ncbi:MAG: hypothetical protein ACI9F9_001979, partial [Candidatus Paceibacteria bacterium]
MVHARFVSFATLLCCFLLHEQAHAQGGYTSEKYPEHGLELKLARDYKWLAVQPNEEWVVLQWFNSEREGGPNGRQVSAKLQVVRIDYVSEPGPSTPSGEGYEPEGVKPEGKGEEAKKEEPAKPLPVNRWSRYLEQQLPGWSAAELATGKPRDGFEATEYELLPKKSVQSQKRWAYVWSNDSVRTFVVLGTTGERDYEQQVDIWRYMAEKMRFAEPKKDPEIEKWERFYKRRKQFKDPEYRIRVRTSLDGKWDAEDTENYIIIFNTRDQPLVSRVVRDLESIRKQYMLLFPPVEEIKAVSTVRICADREEYKKYGGPKGSAGYWYYVTEELVLFDGTKREKGKPTDKLDTFIVLYHEAFHQFIHYSVGQLAPHSWFNEGYGDYFSGAQIKGGKIK